jgi:hypothetical protein
MKTIMSKNEIKTEDVSTAIYHLLNLKNDSYSLDLTLEKALEMGISKKDFIYVTEEIRKTNERIQVIKGEENHELVLTDPKSIEALQQTMPSGQLSSNGQEQVGDSFFAPYAATNVNFQCKGGGAPTPFYTCRTKALGGWKSKTVVGNPVSWTSIDVGLDASNISVSITFQTTDSNGGKANWKATT